MARLHKRARVNAESNPGHPLDAAQAVAALKRFKGPKFDQTVEFCFHLGVDTKQADQMIRGSVSLPKGIGKSKKVVAFCPSDVAPQALEAGAVKAGGEDLVAEIQKGWMDFDVAVASPEMMRVISKLGRVLGPKGLMPSPKAGTVTKDVPQAVREYSAGKVEYRTDKGGNIHGVIGKMSFADEDLLANYRFMLETIERARPASAKGVYIKKITLSGTMTPGIEIKYAPVMAGA